MTKVIIEPTRRIEKSYISMSRLASLLSHGIVLIILGVLYVFGARYGWVNWVQYTIIILIIIDILIGFWELTIGPTLAYKYRRYEVTPHFVQIRDGRLQLVHQVIPMTRIDYVELQQGPIMRKYGLYTIEIGTISSNQNLIGLNQEVAYKLRDEISEYARIKGRAIK